MEKEITCLSNLLAKMRQAWDLSPALLPFLPCLVYVYYVSAVG